MDDEINIFETRDGRFCLAITDTDDETAEVFEEYDLEVDGNTWEAIVATLLRTKMPESRARFEMAAADENLNVYCSTREPLERLAKVIRDTASDQDELIAAIENARDDLE